MKFKFCSKNSKKYSADIDRRFQENFADQDFLELLSR